MRYKVLVVDDSAPVRKAFTSVLERDPTFDVSTAADGMKAVEIASREHPDLILLDIQLPVINGFMVLDEIKKRRIETRVVMMSGAYTDIDTATRCIKGGACDFILKPIDLNDLCEIVKKYLIVENTLNFRVSDTAPIVDSLIYRLQNSAPSSTEVFIIHGQDDGTKETVARFITKLDLEPVILHEQANQGRTIIDKFEQHAATAGFAIALLTPDDVGGLQGNENDWKPRARQNVILELGWFLGRLGRGRVCALKKGDVEEPSDYAGILYISMDTSGWKIELVRELKSAGFDVDANLAL